MWDIGNIGCPNNGVQLKNGVSRVCKVCINRTAIVLTQYAVFMIKTIEFHLLIKFMFIIVIIRLFLDHAPPGGLWRN